MGVSYSNNDSLEQKLISYKSTVEGLNLLLEYLRFQFNSSVSLEVKEFYELCRAKFRFYQTYFQTTSIDQISFDDANNDIKNLYIRINELKSQGSIAPLDLHLFDTLEKLNQMIQ